MYLANTPKSIGGKKQLAEIIMDNMHCIHDFIRVTSLRKCKLK